MFISSGRSIPAARAGASRLIEHDTKGELTRSVVVILVSSGHAITAFACIVPMTLFYPDAGPALYFSACSIAASRIVLGMNFLGDVLIGCALLAIPNYSAFRFIA